MNKHTPGTWEVNERTEVREANGEWVAECCFAAIYRDSNRITKKEEANAEFIVRACNSYDNLIYLLKTCLPLVEHHDEYLGLFCSMGEAIAKAEGV